MTLIIKPPKEEQPAPPSPWVELIRALPEMTMEAFATKFGRDIHVDVKVKYDAAGGRTPVFSFVMAQPGLLPLPAEREWFDGYVSGYRQCCNSVLDMLDAGTNEQAVS